MGSVLSHYSEPLNVGGERILVNGSQYPVSQKIGFRGDIPFSYLLTGAILSCWAQKLSSQIWNFEKQKPETILCSFHVEPC